MKNSIETDLKTYYQEISDGLPRNAAHTLLPDIRVGVDSYLAENPDATIDDVISYVGTPECIVNEYYANQDGTEITRKMNKSRILLVTVVSIVSVVLAACFIFVLTKLVHDILTMPAYSITTLEVGPVVEDVSMSDLL